MKTAIRKSASFRCALAILEERRRVPPMIRMRILLSLYKEVGNAAWMHRPEDFADMAEDVWTHMLRDSLPVYTKEAVKRKERQYVKDP